MKTSKTTLILGAICAGSIILNFYLFKKVDELSLLTHTPDPVTTLVHDCYKSAGYTSAQTITDEQANAFAEEYKASLEDPDIITEGLITRSAFDSLLCTDKCNAISYKLLRDKSGEIGPKDNGVFIYFTGTNAKIDPESGEVRFTDLGLPKYIPQHWCPPTCAP